MSINNSKKKTSISILVLSFDGYQDIWPYFDLTFNKYWKDCPYEVALTTNYAEPKLNNIRIIKTGTEVNWCSRTKKAVQEIDSEYLLLLLEDYFLSEPVDNNHIELIENFIESEEPNYLRLVNIPRKRFKKKGSSIQHLYQDEEYGVNLQASIWKKDYLLSVLNEVNGSAWDFEVFFLKSTVSAKHIEMIKNYATIKSILNIRNGVLKGKWLPKTVNHFKKKNIIIETHKRGSLTKKEEWTYMIRAYFRDILPYGFRKLAKKILTKLNFKFVTKY